ncbi:hypothetical protein DTO021C3_4661 [Paecilomyces variotii]|nr:hypothetical protein DTO021C3_4661 [Paecilomyces variotii]KAJ9301804.1 hypothetical protein DTO217A2_7478 [Paecilomyces variotii]
MTTRMAQLSGHPKVGYYTDRRILRGPTDRGKPTYYGPEAQISVRVLISFLANDIRDPELAFAMRSLELLEQYSNDFVEKDPG